MRKGLIATLIIFLVIGGALFAINMDWLGRYEVDGQITQIPRPAEIIELRATRQVDSLERMDSPEPMNSLERMNSPESTDSPEGTSSLGTTEIEAAKQILFGDFHVHTTFSLDAFLMNLPMAGGIGSRPPSDACDFARYCSALDFWSINDHAELLTSDLWEQTVDSVRQCNDVAGDPSNPDLVTYLGWEWSHIGSTPDTHYGHKNVVLLDTEEGKIPTRPIGSQDENIVIPSLPMMRLGMTALNGRRGLDLSKLLANIVDTPLCETDIPVRELPLDCLEAAPTPEILFEKLDDWGFPSFVIPHGTAWGIYTPAGSDWRKQLPGHDPERQSLIELYSGHGNSEVLPEWREVEIAEDGSLSCPSPSFGYLPSCWHAGELIRDRCLETGETNETCEQRTVEARTNYLESYQAGWKTLPGFAANDWLNSGQAPEEFQPSFNYRPRSSAQYMLAIRDFTDNENPKGFDFGFLGSSDNHSASAGTGYKEFGRGEMSEGRGKRDDAPVTAEAFSMFGPASTDSEPTATSVPFDSSGISPLQLFETERASAYFVTGGLVAVHSAGRDRHAIWNALERKEVYATSGRRMLLWFDLLNDEKNIPMGSTTEQNSAPSFRVRALGSFEQKPGCPDDAIAALGSDRVDKICRGECYHPNDNRRPVSRIEVVRIRPQITEDEPVQPLVEDPWRTFDCPADGAGCKIEFTDDEFVNMSRDTVYYVRAIEASDQLIHGSNPLRCEYDENGVCKKIDPCGSNTPLADNCLSEAEPRAWSSPIYINYLSSDD